MRFKKYIETHQVFTIEEIYSITSKASARTLIGRALDLRDIERVRRGVYVSRTGKFTGEVPDPFRVLSTVDTNAVVSYHSALVALGVSHDVTFECSFRSKFVRSPFEYRGINYIPFDDGDTPLTQRLHAKAYGSVTSTTREQTMVDCFTRTARSGGIEEVIRSCSAFPYIDVETLLELLKKSSTAVVSRVGWILEEKSNDWNIPDTTLRNLEDLLGHGPSKLDPSSKETRGWNGRWKLYLPEESDEVKSWIS